MSPGKSSLFFQLFPSTIFIRVPRGRVCEKGSGRRGPNAAQWPWPAPQPGRHQKGTSEAAARLQTSPFQQVSRAEPQLCTRAGQKAVMEELSHFVLRQVAQMSPARSYQVEEFLQRKREAMLNKFRAEGQLVSGRLAPGSVFRVVADALDLLHQFNAAD